MNPTTKKTRTATVIRDDDLASGGKSLIREIYDHLIHERGICDIGGMTIGCVVEALREEGILFWRDERFRESQQVALELAGDKDYARKGFDKVSREDQERLSSVRLDCDAFVRFVSPHAISFLAVFSEELVIPDWKTFVTDMTYHFHKVQHIEEGENAQYIPVLRDANPHKWGLSICSIDGQRFSIGDYADTFSIQSVSKPVTYGICLATEGEAYVEEWIGVEPAGRPFNTQDLHQDTKTPFNASVNSGAIMAAAVFASRFPESAWNECVDKIRTTWSDLSGHDINVGFSQETYESEKATAYNNIAIAYNLKGRRDLPRDISIQKMLDVYLGCCSIEMTAEGLAVAAATFANGGVCPITRKEVFPAHVVRHVLAETMTCGMYDQAGRFAVDVGLPAKSGVSGALLVIVPNLFGIATFSPRLNKPGNSVRGLAFFKAVVASYRVHIFEPLRSGNCRGKIDPRVNGKKNEKLNLSNFALAYQVGDAWGVRLRDIFLNAMLHVGIAAEEGLSERMRKAIGDEYELIYQVPLDKASLQKAIDLVEPDPTNMSILKNLKKDLFIADEFRNVIMFAMLEILVVDGKISEKESNVALDITNFLGIDRGVALMEVNRHKRHVGPRFKEADPFEASHHLPGGVSSSVLGPSVLHCRTSSDKFDSTETGGKEGESEELNHPHSEVLQLRREVYHLRRKLDAMTQLLQDARDKKTQEVRRLSILPQANKK